MQFRSLGFIVITIVFLLAEGLLSWALYGYSRPPGPFGYAEAESRLMHGKFVHVIGPGKSRHAPSQYLFEDVETGKLKKLHDLFTRSTMLFDRDKGKIFTLQVINDQILTCGLNGQQFCTPKCTSGPQCENIKVAVAAAVKSEGWWTLLVVSIGFAFAYYLKAWRLCASIAGGGMSRIYERTTRPSGSVQRKERTDHMNLRSMSHRFKILKTHLVIAVRAALANQVFNLAKAADGAAVWIKRLTVTSNAPEILEIILVQPHCPTILKNNGMKHDMPLIFQPKPTAGMPYSFSVPAIDLAAHDQVSDSRASPDTKPDRFQ